MSKIDAARRAIDANPGMPSREIAALAGVSHMTVLRARNMKDVPRDVPAADPAPDGWTVVGIDTAAFCRLQERGELDLAGALEIVLAAAESGDLARDDVARIVAARWDVSGECWFHLMPDGSLAREDPGKARPRRSVQQRATDAPGGMLASDEALNALRGKLSGG